VGEKLSCHCLVSYSWSKWIYCL